MSCLLPCFFDQFFGDGVDGDVAGGDGDEGDLFVRGDALGDGGFDGVRVTFKQSS